MKVIVLLMYLATLMACQAGPALPAADGRTVPSMRERVYNRLAGLGDYIGPNKSEADYAAALGELEKLEAYCEKKCNVYERASLHRWYSYVYYYQDKKLEVLEELKEVLRFSPNIPQDMEETALEHAAQVSFALKEFDQAESYFHRYTNLRGGGTLEDKWFLAQIKWRQGSFEAALNHVNEVIKAKEAQSGDADILHYKVKLLLASELDLAAEVIAMKQKLVALGYHSDNNVRPLVRVTPVYPEEARERGIQGQCTIEFDINEQGDPENLEVAECSHPLFEEPSLKAVGKYGYAPEMVAGKSVVVEGVRERLVFKLVP